MNLVYEKKTDKSVVEAVEAIKNNLPKYEFGVLWEVNFKDKINDKGLDFEDDYVVLEVCNPKQAKDVLDINVHIGYVLPCKMIVRSNSGQTYIGMTDPAALIQLFDSKGLEDIGLSIRKDLNNAIKDSI